ncbi:DUF3460 family protein [Herbaspirillum chlorophenolicum]|jgi:hypothetical protein|uniref:DUF3460 family protein n=1 Tax=Herbaspirillum chlorophenolicum TaxID=211589 RepID=A0ABW8F1D7_9BURK|nr:DUF3460 family protein [Herbaspirillum chlorophenolicum]
MFSKKTAYVSEITQFIEELKTKNPALEEQQRAGRALLWDKEPVDLDKTARDKASRVAQQPYVYQSH